jgi:hypothetical protein
MGNRSNIHVFMLLFIVSCSFATAYHKIHYTGKEVVTLLDTFETKNCFISYVLIDGHRYLLKQKKDARKQLAVVKDALAAYIAKKLNIAQRIIIIDANKKFPGKIKESWPATLHTIAPGETIRVQRQSKYNALRLKQKWAQAESFNDKGLTSAIINFMTWHEQLPIIVALDLFIGNSDRHPGNLCYDPTTDTFFAIDMDDTFNKDLCLLAYKKLKVMMHDKNVSFTKEEIAALACMRDVLHFLIRKNKPRDVIAKLYTFAHKAGFDKESKMYNENVRRKLLFYERMIIQTYASANQLVTLLDSIVK